MSAIPQGDGALTGRYDAGATIPPTAQSETHRLSKIAFETLPTRRRQIRSEIVSQQRQKNASWAGPGNRVDLGATKFKLQSYINIVITGGDGGIRTLDRALQPYNGLANRRLQPLGHISAARRDSRPPDMPDARGHCKTRAQPRGYRALWPNGILRASSSVESAFRRPGTSTTRALPALDPTDARLVARRTLVHDAEQASPPKRPLSRARYRSASATSRAGSEDSSRPSSAP